MKTGMNKAAKWLAGAAVLATVSLSASFNVLAQTAATTGITVTKHNLGSAGLTNANNKTTATNEVCVFCHTPHGSNTGAAAPLWNKANTGSTYTPYATTSTLDSPVAAVGSVSLACLSCHDGTQAIDNILNAPGSGGQTTGGGAGGLTYTWAAVGTGALTVDGTGTFSAGVAPNIGVDLSNDHPIGVIYCGGGPTVGTPGSVGNCVDGGFKAPATNGAGSVFWVDTGAGGVGTREKSDMILFNRTFTGSNPSVECASCHDVHSENALFLRMTGGNAYSQVCLACHVK